MQTGNVGEGIKPRDHERNRTDQTNEVAGAVNRETARDTQHNLKHWRRHRQRRRRHQHKLQKRHLMCVCQSRAPRKKNFLWFEQLDVFERVSQVHTEKEPRQGLDSSPKMAKDRNCCVGEEDEETLGCAAGVGCVRLEARVPI